MDYLEIKSLYHSGIKGQKWGVKHGPPYPLDYEDHSAAQKKLNPKSKIDGVVDKSKEKIAKAKEKTTLEKEKTKQYNEKLQRSATAKQIKDEMLETYYNIRNKRLEIKKRKIENKSAEEELKANKKAAKEHTRLEKQAAKLEKRKVADERRAKKELAKIEKERIEAEKESEKAEQGAKKTAALLAIMGGVALVSAIKGKLNNGNNIINEQPLIDDTEFHFASPNFDYTAKPDESLHFMGYGTATSTSKQIGKKLITSNNRLMLPGK